MTPLNEQAYNYLQKLIMENHFSYQEVYSETKLSKELGISRTPLRDAVHRLAQEGYIDIIPSKGFMLHQMNRKDVNETFQVRSALETYCTVQISKASSTRKAKKLFKELDWIMECMNDIMETTHSIKEFSEYDFQFHTKIIDYLDRNNIIGREKYSFRIKRKSFYIITEIDCDKDKLININTILSIDMNCGNCKKINFNNGSNINIYNG